MYRVELSACDNCPETASGLESIANSIKTILTDDEVKELIRLLKGSR